MSKRPSLSERARKSVPGTAARATRGVAATPDGRSAAAKNEVTAMVRGGMKRIAPSTAALWAEEGRKGAGRSK